MWKKLLYVIVGIIVLLGIAVFAATRMVDAERIKQLLVQQVSQRTGQELVFEGDLSWRVFPTLGFDLGAVKLLNRGDFGTDPMLSLTHAGVSVELLPLFSRQVNVGQVQVEGLEANLVTLKDGRSNLQQLLDSLEQAANTAADSGIPAAEPTPEVETQPGGMALGDLSINVAGVAIEDARLTIDDRQQGSVTGLSNVELVVEQFEPDAWVPVRFAARLQQPQMTADVKGKAQLQVASSFDMVRLVGLETQLTASGESIPGGVKELRLGGNGQYDLNQGAAQLSELMLKLDDAISLEGELNIQLAEIPRVRFMLASEGIDLDAFLEKNFPSAEGEPATSESNAAKPAAKSSAPEPDLTFLNDLDVAGELTLGLLKVANLDISDIHIKLAAKSGFLTLQEFVAQLYDGTVSATAKVDGRKVPARFSLSEKLTGVQVRPLLTDLAEVDLLSGNGNISTDLNGVGLTDAALRKNLTGAVNINFADGALYGINIPAKLRTAKAALAGEAAPVGEEEKTDFSELSATFNVGQGVAKTDNIKMLSPFIRVDGRGQAHLVDETLDFNLITELVSTAKGQGGKESDDLEGVEIPLKITGSWSDPKFKLAVEEVLQQRLEEEKQKLKQKADEELRKQQEKLQQKLQQEEGQLEEKLQQQLQDKLDLNKLFGR